MGHALQREQLPDEDIALKAPGDGNEVVVRTKHQLAVLPGGRNANGPV